MRADDPTLEALAVVLSQAEAATIIRRLGHLNLSLITSLRDLSPDDQALLLALARQH